MLWLLFINLNIINCLTINLNIIIIILLFINDNIILTDRCGTNGGWHSAGEKRPFGGPLEQGDGGGGEVSQRGWSGGAGYGPGVT